MLLRLVLVGLLLLRWNSVGFRSILFRPRMRVSLPATRISSESAGKDKAWLEAKGRTLVIVESPAKAKTIQKFLNEDEYIVDFCLGHVRDLPSAAREVGPEYRKKMVLDAIKLNVADLGVDVQNGFEPLYVPMAGKSEVLKRLIKLSKECSRILLATDEDREGEAISWHLLEVLKPKVPYKRAVFHEITKGAILDSFENPRDIDMNLVQSQETRRILDRLAGYTISPVLWRYVATGLSAGRVQSCGLYLIAQVGYAVCLCVCACCVVWGVVCCVLCAVCCGVCVCVSLRPVDIIDVGRSEQSDDHRQVEASLFDAAMRRQHRGSFLRGRAGQISWHTYLPTYWATTTHHNTPHRSLVLFSPCLGDEV